MTVENITLFQQRGAVFLSDFVDKQVCGEMIRSIDALRVDEVMNVDRSNPRFRTAHGDLAAWPRQVAGAIADQGHARTPTYAQSYSNWADIDAKASTNADTDYHAGHEVRQRSLSARGLRDLRC